MNNEELAALIVNENREDLIPVLWEQVSRLIYMIVDRFYKTHTDRFCKCGVDLWDVRQAAYFAFLSAVRCFRAEDGYKFTTYLRLPLKNEINALLGARRKTPVTLNTCVSLNEPVGNDEDTCERIELIADTSDSDIQTDIEEDEDSTMIRAAVDELPERLKYVVQRYFFDEIKLEAIAQELNVTAERIRQLKYRALRELRKNKQLYELYRESVYLKRLQGKEKLVYRPDFYALYRV